MDILLITLIVLLYFVGGAFFCLAYVNGYPEDTEPNLGITVVFWIPIVIIHVCVQLVRGIGSVGFGMARKIEKPIRKRVKGRQGIPYGKKIYPDKGPGTGVK